MRRKGAERAPLGPAVRGGQARRDRLASLLSPHPAATAALGARFAVGIETRIDVGAGIVGHKPSTRHDIEQGRPLERDALVSAVQDLARGLSLPTPVLDTLAALARMQGHVPGLHIRRPEVEAAITGPRAPAS